MPRKPRDIVAFGDFQTPDALAIQATRLLAEIGLRPASVIEPTCGKGAFLAAAAQTFPEARLRGTDINPDHLAVAAARGLRAEIQHGDFFATPWPERLRDLPEPWLILGNPPWVTVAGLATVRSANAPARQNATKLRGLEAVTGRSNFDISEWMIRAYLDWLDDRAGTISVLCKTAVARKVLASIWKAGRALKRARLYKIDAHAHFGAAVDAGLLIVETGGTGAVTSCDVYESLDAKTSAGAFGWDKGMLVADVQAFNAHRALLASGAQDDWRSGIKHDCAAFMELTRTPRGFRNGLGEELHLEDANVYPLLKSGDLANGRLATHRVMIVPQHFVGDDTTGLRARAPRTWDYLMRHEARFAARKSTIYRGRPPFAIFGVGPYTFAPWKVAISGLYKRPTFRCVGPVEGKPVVFDDTVSFLACADEAQARKICALLNGGRAQEFLNAMIFWSDKRPITTGLLRRLSLRALAGEHCEFDVLAERERA